MLRLKDISEIHGVPISTLGALCRRLGINSESISENSLGQICEAIYELPKPKPRYAVGMHIPVFGEDVLISTSHY